MYKECTVRCQINGNLITRSELLDVRVMARRDFNVKLFAQWQAQELEDSVKFWNVAAWFSKSCRLGLEPLICGKWHLKRRKLGVCPGITNLAVLASQKRFRREFGVVVDWTYPLTSNLHNNAGCVWKEKSPSRLPVHRSCRTKFERLMLVQENQDQLPDSWACHNGLCTEFCELVRCVKVTNIHRSRQAS